MLYETFNSLKEAHGEDYFTSRVPDYLIQNLNPKFELREYQKEAIGRFDFYFSGDFKGKKIPSQLLFNMATGSGKTLIMASNILQLYKKGYRNFVFFVNSVNIIEKTKDNFLNPLSEKYLFAPKIKFDGKEVLIKEVQNFETASPEDINILFTTIQALHIRLNYPKEDSLTFEDFTDKEIVLISDEAHHLQTLTRGKEEVELERGWEYTVGRIFNSNIKNILLEFTATIDLGNNDIRQKYEDKIIFQYDLKHFRLDKYSKEIEVLEADLEPVERALQAVILSQYRRKVAGRNGIELKPVILFKSKSIKESKENYEGFLEKIRNLNENDIESIKTRVKGSKTALEKAFNYFEKENISSDGLTTELKEEFSSEKCMLLDSENIDEEKQLKLNSLEDKNNEIRAIFAVNMLNEGWDVLNLFDIVRLYETRDGKWIHGQYKPGKTTIGEAQLIGRGARYYPFQSKDGDDKYKRKFDDDIENELRMIETLHYHSARNSRYIDEIKSALRGIGILPEEYYEKSLFIKEEFKKSEFWTNGIVFLNDRIVNKREKVKSLADANIKREFEYQLQTGEVKEESIFGEDEIETVGGGSEEKVRTFKLIDFGKNVLRYVLDKYDFYRFDNLKKYFPNVNSLNEFISSENYLGSINMKLKGSESKLNSINYKEKVKIVSMVVSTIADQAKENTSEFEGNKIFKPYLLKKIFGQNDGLKKLKFSSDDGRAVEFKEIDLSKKEWYAQNTLFGTSEEQNFLKFIEEIIEEVKKRYYQVAILRNERFFTIYDFDEGRAFEPDFLMLLKEEGGKIKVYQIFIEPKGDQFKDAEGSYENSKEGWKQTFLLSLEKDAKIEYQSESSEFKFVSLPFYNEGLKREFEKVFKEKLLR
jgi:type III restriction enzyme